MGQIYVWAADAEVLRLFTLLLSQESHEVWGASERSAFESRLSIAIPDMCIIDLDRLDGVLAFHAWCEGEPLLRVMPCLYISGRLSRETTVCAELASRGATILDKPLQRDPFIAQVSAFLSPQEGTAQEGHVSVGGYEEHQGQSFSSPELEAALIDRKTLNRVKGRRVGSVLLQHEIGRGGMGIVFKGRQASLDRDVAVKMILPRLYGDEAILTRLQREALAIARLKNKHIVRVFDAGNTSEGVFFIVMEWLAGEDLEQQLLREGAMPLIDALKIIRQMALGLCAAHNEGLIHRDIKPSNIIVNQTGHSTLTDFGLARHNTDARLTGEGVVLGTAHYLSPEQIMGATIDHRTDMYSLGIVLFEMLSGQVPYPVEPLTAVMRMHLEEPLPDLRRTGPQLSEDMWELLSLMTAKVPQDRYETCEALVQAIDERLAAHQPPPPRPQRFSGSRLLSRSQARASSSWGGPSQEPPSRLASLSSSHGIRNLIAQADQIGGFRMSMSGSIHDSQGQVDASWRDSLQLIFAIIQQLEATVGLGMWEETLCEALPHSMFFGLEGGAINAEIFQHQQIPTSLRMVVSSPHVTPAPPSRGQASPLIPLSSAAGVQGLMLMSELGELQAHILPPELEPQVEAFAQRLSPLAHLFASLPFQLEGMDCTFEEGRFLLWALPHQYLFVMASHQLNKTLLSLLVWRYREQLMQVGSQLHTPIPQGRVSGQISVSRPLIPASVRLSSSQAPSAPQHVPAQPRAITPDSLDVNPLIPTPATSVPGDEALLSAHDIRAIQHEFARHIGPMAKLIWKREVKKLGYASKEIPQRRASHLIQRLAQHLDSPKRYDFLEGVAQIEA